MNKNNMNIVETAASLSIMTRSRSHNKSTVEPFSNQMLFVDYRHDVITANNFGSTFGSSS